MPAYGFKALVSVEQWTAPPFACVHARAQYTHSDAAEGGDNIQLEFNMWMNREGVTNRLSFDTLSSGKGAVPTVAKASMNCGFVRPQETEPPRISGVSPSMWSWSGTL